MPYTTAQAPVAFSGYTSIAGSGNTQIIPVSANGVTQGLTAGNLYLDLASVQRYERSEVHRQGGRVG